MRTALKLLFLFLLFAAQPAHAQTIELPCPIGTFPVGQPILDSVTGQLRETSCGDAKGNIYEFPFVLTATQVNKIQHCETFAGATADAQITACITALPAGGIADASGFGASTQLLAAQVNVPAGVTLLFDPNTKFQASSSSLNPFLVKANSHIKGLHFDCGNQPSYAGTIFTFNDTYRAQTADTTNQTTEDIFITCAGVSGGTAAALTSANAGQVVSFLEFRHWRQNGLLNQILMTPSGNGFIAGNTFADLQMTAGSASSIQWHMTQGGGQIHGNICNYCTFEAGSFGGSQGWVVDGTNGGSDLNYGNIYFGTIYDTTNAITWNNSIASRNLAWGRFDGTITDSFAGNNWFNLAGTGPTAQLLAFNTMLATFGATATFNANIDINGKFWNGAGAPTIAAAGCGGSGASISANSGTNSFDINVGTAPASTGCTVTMPAATTNWNCAVNDFTTISTSVFVQKQISSTTTSVVFQNFSDAAVATAPTAGDIYHVTGCAAK